jgi:L-threonylcarbamoyladenylate synthase
MPPAPESYGRLLYATLRRLDNQGFDRLLIEALPDEPEWTAVMDRLRRASCNDVKTNSKDEAVYG